MTTEDLGTRLKALDAGQAGTNGHAPAVPRRSRKQEDPRRAFPIDVTRTSLPAMSSVAWQAITAANTPPKWFTVGSTPVRLAHAEADEPVRTEELGLDALSGISARTAFWHKHKEKEGDVEQFPLLRVMADMLADPQPPLPKLARIVAAPVFGADGSLSTQPGYNPATQVYYAARGLTLPDVPERPTADDVAAAKALLLDELLGDFPFVGDAERAHALSLLLNPFVRDLVDGPTPMYLIEAPSAGTGKGLLARMAMLPALGAEPPVMPPATNEEETRKRLTSTLVGLPETVFLDNVAQGLDSPSLAAALTTTVWTDRMLGRTESRSVRVRATWMATGNNPSLSKEIQRRIVRIRLDARAERPEERRGFRHPDLEHWARAHRAELVHAALVLVQAWVAEGLLLSDHTLGSFDDWAKIHGGILATAGVPGFLTNRRASELTAVTEEVAWRAFVAAWWEAHRDQAVAASELFPLAQGIDGFPLGAGSTERSMRTAFGMALSHNRDRVFNGRCVEFVGTAQRAAQYRLRPTGETPF